MSADWIARVLTIATWFCLADCVCSIGDVSAVMVAGIATTACPIQSGSSLTVLLTHRISAVGIPRGCPTMDVGVR